VPLHPHFSAVPRQLPTSRTESRPKLFRGRRARGSGTNVQAVNQLVKQFHQMRKLMKRLGEGKMPDLGALMRQAR